MLRTSRISSKLLTLCILALTFTACDKDDDDNNSPMDETIAGTVMASADFTALEAAVVKADLKTTLEGPGPFTVFAPDDAAFNASGISSTTLNSLTKEQVSTILLYHTLAARVPSTDVPAGPNAKVITASGDSVFVTKNSSGVFVNGIKVAQADIAASNGVIHQIEKVLLPPAGNLVEVAQGDGSGLDSLVKAIVRANDGPGGSPTLIATLQSGIFTVFAPTNEAFASLLTDLGLANIDDIPMDVLLAVLQYHLVPSRAFSSDLANESLTMLASGTTTINLSDGTNGGPSITGTGNTKANIVATNIMARNGVVHVIDKVLLP
jgi:uncharacterized surface protein with fasciclin (FAS1) repeats